ncbi:MAG: calmodulin-binding protein, partial [Pseudomonas sp.]|nr:calmodulin-binding protein [Pseudomonas sp.]
MSSFEGLFSLVASVVGQPAAQWLESHVEVTEELHAFSWSDTAVHRVWLAEALNLCLLHKLVEAVPAGRLYVNEQAEDGRKVVFDHGAIRTVDWFDNGELPRGRQAFTRLLEPLGFTDVRTYPLTKLNMTGWGYRQQDLPEDIAQFFVSELHPGRFSEGFQAAVGRAVRSSRDPLNAEQLSILHRLQLTRHCDLSEAYRLLPGLYAAFGRQHGVVQQSDYQLLLSESAEMAWISTEGNSFNHLTDRVTDLEATVEEQIRRERPMKDSIEVSASGRVMQTAYKACTVQRELADATGKLQTHAVPGSFVEFIQRKLDPVDDKLDLNFDSSNAQG